MCDLPTICGLTACSRSRKGHYSSLLSWKYPCREAICPKNRYFCVPRLLHPNRIPACPARWYGASYTGLWFGKSCPTADTPPEIIRKAVAKEIDKFFLIFFYDFVFCTQNYAIANATNLQRWSGGFILRKKRKRPQISPWQHPMQVILNISGKYPLSYNWWRVDKNLRVYLPEGHAPIQNNMFPCTARNKSEHAGRKWYDVCRHNTTHIWKSGYHPLSRGLFPFRKKAQALWKMLALSIENPNKISKSARLIGWDAFINSLATRIRLEVGLTPFLFKIFSMFILFIYYDLSQ